MRFQSMPTIWPLLTTKSPVAQWYSIRLDHGGSWVQIPSGTRMFSESTCLLEFTENKIKLKCFIKSILKSLVILAMWLTLSGAIYSRIALSFALNRIFFSANENGTVKQNDQSDFKAFFKLTNYTAERWKTKSRPLFGKFGNLVE